MAQKRRLPAPNDFTPGVLGGPESLFDLLDLVAELRNKAQVVGAIRDRWFSEHAAARSPDTRSAMQMKLANNVLLGMKILGLVDEDTNAVLSPTECAIEVVELDADGERDEAYRRFASHLLRNCYGTELLHVAQDVMRRDGHVSLPSLRAELATRGFDVPTNSGTPSRIRLWLEPSGVVDSKWRVNQELLAQLANTTSDEIVEWRSLTEAQREMLIALRLRAEGNRTELQAHDALLLLSQRGVEFQEAQAKRTLWNPLVEGGWITQDVRGGGRGAKGGLISITDKTLELDVEFISGLALGDIPQDLQDQLTRPVDEILDTLNSSNTYDKGIALELLALRLAADSGLMPDRFRERSQRTGGGEVDLIAEAVHLHFSRWLFQCKNQQSPVRVDVLAKEIGMATLLKAQVVVIVTTSTFTKTVVEYALGAAESTAIQVVLLDKTDLEAYRTRGMRALRDRLHSQALNTRRIKQTQFQEMPVEVEN
ncbi:restriction endonuclease [Leucobacter sp. W1478]|uniref:restriction endonuclease n=1 Tax=Leucobacter sp. W1478 TaxID=3439065 RepID=UPI003F407C5E